MSLLNIMDLPISYASGGAVGALCSRCIVIACQVFVLFSYFFVLSFMSNRDSDLPYFLVESPRV